MKHLKKITISNARRFAKDVSIDFGKGATILLAPNGTGKTTVFEAIEFALTGAIQRLDRPPLALIRDNESGVDVRLDFEDGLYCQVNYRKGSNPVLTGHHDVIFPNRNIDEIPYLVRLTHLLEQRGANWFVQQPDANEAGQLLDKLSIGKELNKIFSSKTSATRAANAALEQAGNTLKENKEKLGNFNELISARSKAKTDFTLISLNKLIKEINSIYSLFSESKYEIEEKVSAVISHVAQIESQLTSKSEMNSEYIVKLAKVEGFVGEYISNKQILLTNQASLKEIGLSIDVDNKELERINEELKKISAKNNEFRTKLGSLIGLRDCFARMETTNSETLSVKKEITDISLAVSIAKEKLESVNKQIESAKEKNGKYELLSEQEEALAKTKGEINSKKSILAEWKDIIFKIDTASNSVLPTLREKENDLVVQLANKKNNVDALEKEFIKSQDFLSSLKNVSDSVSSAVSLIANNFPKDKGECPVCSAKYTPEELQSRISKAVSYIDPLLNDATANNKILNDQLIISKAEYAELQAKLNAVRIERENIDRQIKLFEANIRENIVPKFQAHQEINEASNWLEAEILHIEKKIENIQNEKKLLVEIVKFEELELLTLQKQKSEREINLLSEQLQSNLSKQLSLNEALENLKEQFGSNSIEEIRKAIIEVERLAPQNLTALEHGKQSQSLIQNQILEKVKKVTDENAKNTQIKSRQSEVIAQWNEVGLQGEPNITTLTERKDFLSKEKNNLNKGKDVMMKIGEELAKWKIAEEFEKYNSEIKLLCGSLSEDDHIKSLNTIIQHSQKEYSLIEEKIKTLRNLYSKIGTELETTHGYLKEINPRWNALLSRVVVNPRFAETSLNSYNYRNKPQAEVHVKMHGAPTRVIDVASEAQITDIQLTFMLAMANTYEWTPWKALLLDDPTQHHDLVHSASVFDLLRDYVTTNDYQILLGTHDSVHANFFKRKLDNDGINARIWNLTSDDDGVKAVCIE